MIHLSAATVLAQWAIGTLAMLWVTTRRREVTLGYGWSVRISAMVIAFASIVVSVKTDAAHFRDVAVGGVIVAAGVALAVSVVRRRAGVRGQRENIVARQERLYERTGIERTYKGPDRDAPEFPPALDLVAPAIGLIALVAAGVDAGGPVWLAVSRTLVGAGFLGAITNAMLLGHWYLVQPGLARKPLLEMVHVALWIWPVEVALLLVPTGMWSVLNGTIDDKYGGTLGWMWAACAVLTGGLLVVTKLALRERYYSAVMAATGLTYLAIMTGFGTDLIARALLGGV